MARIRGNGNGTKKKEPPQRKTAPRAEAGAGSPEDEPSEHQHSEQPHSEQAGTGERRTAGGFREAASELPPIFRTFAESSSQIVQKAVSILEEELAAGIVAARQIENKFFDSEELRSGKPDDILQRFRRDGHEVLDMVIDVVGATARNASRLAKRAISIREERVTQKETATPVLTMTQPVKAGEKGEVSLVIENDGETATETFELRATDLISASGDSIPAHLVQFEPKSIGVAPHQNQRVVVTVTPPVAATPGTYSGLIQSSRPDQLRAVLTIQVV